MTNKFHKELDHLNPCKPANIWVKVDKIKSWKQAWYKCDRGDWVVWLLMKIRVPKPYGRYAVIALEQGFGSPDVFNLSEFTADPLRDMMGSPDCNWLAANTVRIMRESECKDYNNPYKYLELCANRVRKVVPWKIISAALKELRENNFVYR